MIILNLIQVLVYIVSKYYTVFKGIFDWKLILYYKKFLRMNHNDNYHMYIMQILIETQKICSLLIIRKIKRSNIDF